MQFQPVRTISNPLTVVALFAGISEVSATVVLLKLTNPEVATRFLWFVMLFPSVLLAAFFVTLNFNHRVLYAPSDYDSSEDYLVANKLLEASMRTPRPEPGPVRTKVKTLGDLAPDPVHRAKLRSKKASTSPKSQKQEEGTQGP